MANSVITRRAMAAALKELMEDTPFSRITVSMICQKCGMNRKSFYYHFKDKYDLASNIIDIEYFEPNSDRRSLPVWERFRNACNYFYENREFYRLIIDTKGQMSLFEHFRTITVPVIREDIKDLNSADLHQFYLDFYSDAIFHAFVRWIKSDNPIIPGEFCSRLMDCIRFGTLNHAR